MSDPWTDIVLTACELKVAAHPQYEAFVRAIKNLEEKLKDDLVAADKDQFPTGQGQAQLVRHVRRRIEDCFKYREELKRRQ